MLPEEIRFPTPNEELRAERVLDLGGVDDPEKIKKLVQILETDESRFVREAAVVALICTGTEGVAKEVAELLWRGDEYLRTTACNILQCLGGPAEGVLAELLADPDPDVRLLTVRIIGSSEYLPLVHELLKRALESETDAFVAACAAEYLSSCGRPEDAELLEAARRRFSDPFLDTVVDEALKRGKPNKKSSRAQR